MKNYLSFFSPGYYPRLLLLFLVSVCSLATSYSYAQKATSSSDAESLLFGMIDMIAIDPDAAKAKLDSLMMVHPELNDEEPWVLYCKGYIYYFLDKPRLSTFYLQKASEHLSAFKPLMQSNIFFNLTEAYGEMCNWDKSVEAAQRGIATLSDTEDPRVLAQLYQGLGVTLCELKQYDEAMKSFTKAIELYSAYPKKGFMQIKKVKRSMARTYYLFQKMGDEGIELLRPLIKEMNELPAEKRAYYFGHDQHYWVLLTSLHSTIVTLYDIIGKSHEGEPDALLAQKYMKEVNYPELAIYEDLIEHYAHVNQPSKAEALLAEATARYGGDMSPSTISEVLTRWKKMIAYTRHDYQEAYRLQAEEMAIKDSVKTYGDREAALEMTEIYRTFEKEKQIAVQKKQITTYKISVYLATVILVLCISFALYMVRVSKRIREKNQVLYRQLQQESDHFARMEQLIHVSVETPAAHPKKEELPLFNQLCVLMYKDHLYLNPTLRIKEVSALLNSNEKYLADAIREETQMTFLNYIGRLRIEHAKKLFREVGAEHKIESIGYDSGFSSYRTFVRTFKKETGLTPSEYLELSASEDAVPPSDNSSL